ncbi:hypothetical protein ACROYT_G041634 [Oculina patagonica]
MGSVGMLAMEAETAAKNNGMRTLYKTTKKMRGDYGTSQDKPVKTVDGRPVPLQTSDIPERVEYIDIPTDPITVEEVKQAIKKLRYGKAPGEDEVCAEMLKASGEETARFLCLILQNAWDTEQIPEGWKTGLIIPLPKKGDLSGNWRGVTLLSITSKLFCRILLNMIPATVEENIRNEQAGSRKGWSCIDHIFALRQILEQSIEWNSNLYVLFIDFEKAFDSLNCESLWIILRSYGFPRKIVNIIRMLYEDFQCKVVCGQHLTDSFRVETGVKQGCILSLFLFLLAMDWLMRRTTAGKKRGIQWTLTTTLEDLDFAEDIGLLSNRHNDNQENVRKTKLMKLNTTKNQPVTINNQQLEEVNEFTYLGSKVSTDGDSGKDVSTRLSKANQAF